MIESKEAGVDDPVEANEYMSLTQEEVTYHAVLALTWLKVSIQSAGG